MGVVLEGVGAPMALEEDEGDEEEEEDGRGGTEDRKEKEKVKEALKVPSEVVEAAVKVLSEELQKICVVVDGRGEVLVR